MSRILVVEDDPQFREMLVQMLRLDKHDVTIAADGMEGLELARRCQPDLIITDILMARMDGVETIVELARQGSRIPIIAMSGGRRTVTAEFNLESAGLLGVSATLAKPFTRADLRKAIDQALRSREAARIATP
jgi:CheY-like chemotaxis protein